MFSRILVVAIALWGMSEVGHSAEIFPVGSNWRYFLGTQDASTPIEAWQAANFDDSGWSAGAAPVGYPSPSNPENITTLLPTSQAGGYLSVYLRKTFVLSNPGDVTQLDLGLLIDDSCLVWINGHYVGSFNIPGTAPADVALPYNAPDLYASWPAIEQTSAAITITNDLASFLVAGTNAVAVHLFNANWGSSDLVFDASLSASVDVVPPTVVDLLPPAGTTVNELRQIEVVFSESVANVDAADLLINGQPATSLTISAPWQYVFEFAQPATGRVDVAWSPAHGIQDGATTPNLFAGGGWYYTLDPNAAPPGIVLNEFMADNGKTYRDEEGKYVDWIELYNSGTTAQSLYGWYLTDQTNNLTRWRFPGVTLLPNSYLIVFASGNDRTNPASPLHTNFRLNDGGGGYLALVNPSLRIVSEIAAYPRQYGDVSYGRDRVNPGVLGYFPTPTPGGPNTPGGPGFAPEVAFSVPSSTFANPLSLVLSTPSSSAVIRYSLGTNLPTELSTLYSGPIPISTTTVVRTRAYVPGLLPGPVRTETYVQLAAGFYGVRSDLPIMILHNLGKGDVPASADQFVIVQVFEPGTVQSTLTNLPDFSGHGIFHKRGSSTLGMAKASFFLETEDEYFDDRKVPLAGLPEDSDWVLYAPNYFEPVLLHNPVAFELSRQMGPYAARTRFVEVYLKDNAGALTTGDYNGVYVLGEKIKVGDHRVDIDKLRPENTQPPYVTGGYLLSIDRSAPGTSPFWAGNASINYLDPDYFDITTPQRANQQQYIQSYFNTFYTALTGPNWTNTTSGYAAYIDVPSWIDHNLHGVVTFNVDALRLSGYFYKPRSGKIEMGPVWDFDRTQGSADGRDFNPRLWRSTVPDYGTDMFNSDGIFPNPWYSVLFTDIEFWQQYIDRYQELRGSVLANTNLTALIDRYANEVRTAQPREVARWGESRPRSGTASAGGYSYTFPGTYQGEVDFMKRWYSNRLDFIDTNFLAKPVLSLPEGPVAGGTILSLSARPGSTIFYTLDGTDPRARGGNPTLGALTYSGPIPINANIRVVARARDLNHQNLTGANKPPLSSPWSGPAAATFVVQPPPLRITEIMYHAAPPPVGNTNDADNFEYLEVMNTGTASLNLAGFQISGGIDVTLTNLSLAAGQRAVVVRDVAAFQSRYGAGALIAGVYTNNLANDGDQVVLRGPLLEPILDFTYHDDWYPITDGRGFSLAVVDENAPLTNWVLQTQWRPNGQLGGTPGGANLALPAFPVVLVNEVLAHTDLPWVDTVELWNVGPAAADVSGWLLSDKFDEPARFRIPTNTIIPSGEFVLFDQRNLHPTTTNGFLLSELGDALYLFSADANTNLTGYVHGFDFGASENGVSFGRYVTSLGEEHFVAQTAGTLGTNNAGPHAGPVVINEIMYWPPSVYSTNNNTRDEFIELHNLTGSPVPLYDPRTTNQLGLSTNMWKLAGGVEFELPANVTLPAQGFLLLVGFDPTLQPGELAAFRSRYGLDASTSILGPFRGQLENTGEHVRLLKPGPPEPPDSLRPGFVPYILMDGVHYLNLSPWPTNANASSNSLQRIAASQYGNDPINWQAASPTPGAINQGSTNPDRDGDGLPNEWETTYGLNPDSAVGADGAAGDPDGDGLTNLQEYVSGTDPQDPGSYLRVESIHDAAEGVQIRFRAVVDKTYSVLYRSPLDATGWLKLANVPAQPVTGEISVLDESLQTAESRFYRLVTPARP